MGFAPRQLLLLLVFSHTYILLIFLYFVAITPGLQTTVSSVVWSARYFEKNGYPLRADFQPVRIPRLTKKNSETLKVYPNSLAERVGFAPRQLLLLLVFSHTYILLIFLYFVAITPGLQTTVSSVVWSARYFEKNGYPLRADFQPVRIPRLTKKNSDTL